MKRIAIYAHYDARGEVKRYVLHTLRHLREECDEVHFVSTAVFTRTGRCGSRNG